MKKKLLFLALLFGLQQAGVKAANAAGPADEVQVLSDAQQIWLNEALQQGDDIAQYGQPVLFHLYSTFMIFLNMHHEQQRDALEKEYPVLETFYPRQVNGVMVPGQGKRYVFAPGLLEDYFARASWATQQTAIARTQRVPWDCRSRLSQDDLTRLERYKKEVPATGAGRELAEYIAGTLHTHAHLMALDCYDLYGSFQHSAAFLLVRQFSRDVVLPLGKSKRNRIPYLLNFLNEKSIKDPAVFKSNWLGFLKQLYAELHRKVLATAPDCIQFSLRFPAPHGEKTLYLPPTLDEPLLEVPPVVPAPEPQPEVPAPLDEAVQPEETAPSEGAAATQQNKAKKKKKNKDKKKKKGKQKVAEDDSAVLAQDDVVYDVAPDDDDEEEAAEAAEEMVVMMAPLVQPPVAVQIGAFTSAILGWRRNPQPAVLCDRYQNPAGDRHGIWQAECAACRGNQQTAWGNIVRRHRVPFQLIQYVKQGVLGIKQETPQECTVTIVGLYKNRANGVTESGIHEIIIDKTANHTCFHWFFKPVPFNDIINTVDLTRYRGTYQLHHAPADPEEAFTLVDSDLTALDKQWQVEERHEVIVLRNQHTGEEWIFYKNL